MKAKEYCYILEYSTGSLYYIELEEDSENIDIEILFKEYGLNTDECSWMFTTEKLYLNKLDKSNRL